jgi:hypothetical protein
LPTLTPAEISGLLSGGDGCVGGGVVVVVVSEALVVVVPVATCAALAESTDAEAKPRAALAASAGAAIASTRFLTPAV